MELIYAWPCFKSFAEVALFFYLSKPSSFPTSEKVRNRFLSGICDVPPRSFRLRDASFQGSMASILNWLGTG